MRTTSTYIKPSARPEKEIEKLRSIMSTWPEFVDFVLGETPASTEFKGKFELWPGSLSKHHPWPGGLLTHTIQVCDFSQGLVETGQKWVHPNKLSIGVVLLASMFHDLGKVYDYQIIPTEEGLQWGEAPHFKRVHHLVKSYDLWNVACSETGINKDFQDHVGHCILAHHGELSYGSPVRPDSQEAWVVHLADMASVNTVETRWKNQ